MIPGYPHEEESKDPSQEEAGSEGCYEDQMPTEMVKQEVKEESEVDTFLNSHMLQIEMNAADENSLQEDPGSDHRSSDLDSEDGDTEQNPWNYHACAICKATFHTASECDMHTARHSIDQSASLIEKERNIIKVLQQPGINATAISTNPSDNRAKSGQSGVRCKRKRVRQEETHQCMFCEKIFKHRSRWEEHVMVHTGIKPFVCPVCSRKFREKSKLTRHMRVHTGEKPFGCEFCQQSFTRSDTLMNHIRAAHVK